MAVELRSLDPIVEHLRAGGYTVIGPTLADGAIILAELRSAADLPYGWGVETGPGIYRIRERPDRAAFGHSVGPQSWKRFLHPPRDALWSANFDEPNVTFDEPPEPTHRYAFIGVRACDLRAIGVQDRVLGHSRSYGARRRNAFLVAVNCTEPSGTCFCATAGGGPEAGEGFDLALTELTDSTPCRYVATAATEAGQAVLDALAPSPSPAPSHDVTQAREAIAAAVHRMGRALPDVSMSQMLAATLEAPRWEDVAARCLACGNCTMACPTCFCTSVADTTDLTGEHAQRWQRWASCFEIEFSQLHGAAVRTTTRSRYRQWLTHKLGTWHDQFGESGCVGCGRCITWCPVGIDITEEASALAHHLTTSRDPA